MASLFGLQIRQGQKYTNQERVFYTGRVYLQTEEIAHWVQDPFEKGTRDMIKMKEEFSEIKLRECVKELLESENPFWGRDKGLTETFDLSLERVLLAIQILNKKEKNMKQNNVALLVRSNSEIFADDLDYDSPKTDEEIIRHGMEAWGKLEDADPIILRYKGNFDIGTAIDINDIKRH